MGSERDKVFEVSPLSAVNSVLDIEYSKKKKKSLLQEAANQMSTGSNFIHVQVYQINLISPLKVLAFNSGASGAEQF